jgi:hypothetical protein
VTGYTGGGLDGNTSSGGKRHFPNQNMILLEQNNGQNNWELHQVMRERGLQLILQVIYM